MDQDPPRTLDKTTLSRTWTLKDVVATLSHKTLSVEAAHQACRDLPQATGSRAIIRLLLKASEDLREAFYSSLGRGTIL